MYTLRKIIGNNYENNVNLGNEYGLILREVDYEGFKNTFEKFFKQQHVADLDENSDDHTKNCYGFILGDKSTQPLYKKQHNYILTENGKILSDLTYE